LTAELSPIILSTYVAPAFRLDGAANVQFPVIVIFCRLPFEKSSVTVPAPLFPLSNSSSGYNCPSQLMLAPSFILEDSQNVYSKLVGSRSRSKGHGYISIRGQRHIYKPLLSGTVLINLNV